MTLALSLPKPRKILWRKNLKLGLRFSGSIVDRDVKMLYKMGDKNRINYNKEVEKF